MACASTWTASTSLLHSILGGDSSSKPEGIQSTKQVNVGGRVKFISIETVTFEQASPISLLYDWISSHGLILQFALLAFLCAIAVAALHFHNKASARRKALKKQQQQAYRQALNTEDVWQEQMHAATENTSSEFGDNLRSHLAALDNRARLQKEMTSNIETAAMEADSQSRTSDQNAVAPTACHANRGTSPKRNDAQDSANNGLIKNFPNVENDALSQSYLSRPEQPRNPVPDARDVLSSLEWFTYATHSHQETLVSKCNTTYHGTDSNGLTGTLLSTSEESRTTKSDDLEIRRNVRKRYYCPRLVEVLNEWP